MIEAINPATGERVESYPETSAEELDGILDGAVAAQRAWSATAFTERAKPMRRAAELLRARAKDLARTMALEMGKPLKDGAAEVEKCAWVCDHYAEHAERYLAPVAIASDAGKSYVRYDPLGVVLAVMPWNFPFWQVFRFAAPHLMAGNAGLLKHAANVPGCALAIERVLHDAGFPRALFRALLMEAKDVGHILADARVAAATLTGSERAGRSVGEHAGRALKKVVLELGGSDAFIVLDDADLDRAAAVGTQARLLNAGQSCICAKRFIVVERHYEGFIERMARAMEKVKVGDPLADGTEMGPLARRDLRGTLHAQVERAAREGARVVMGGEVPPGPGAFYPPTILADVREDNAAAREETFGPVAAVMRAKDAEDAIRIANTSTFGLGASLWTESAATAERWVPRIEAGSVFVNGLVKSDPRLPFGGIKASGFGRELGREGILEFVNVKTVWIR